MTFQTYSLTRVIDGGHAEFAQSFTTSDDDAINCAHMLAAGFNTMSRNMLSGWVLAVVDTKDGRVFYDDKAEHIRRDTPSKPGVYEQTFKFEPSVDADTIVSLLSGGGGNGMFSAFGKVDVQSAGPYEAPSKYAHVARSVLEDAYAEMQAVKSIVEEVGVETIPLSTGVREMQYMIENRDEEIAAFHQERLNNAEANTTARDEQIADLKQTLVEETDETTSAVAADKVAPTMSRKVLEAAYVELHRVKDVLFDAGMETIPADAGVKDLRHLLRTRSNALAEFVQERANTNEAARAELVGHVKGAYSKWSRIDPGRTRSDLKSHLRGMLEVLSKYLVAIGEADADERHAVALRVCGIPEGNYLYDEQ